MKLENISDRQLAHFRYASAIGGFLATLAVILVAAVSTPHQSVAQPGTDVNLPCGTLPFAPQAACLATGPRPGEEGPYPEQTEGDSVAYGPMDPPPLDPAGVRRGDPQPKPPCPFHPGRGDWARLKV